MAKTKSGGMSAEHKAALAKGRAQAKAVREYLNMIERDGRRTSRMSEEQLNSKIHELDARIQEESDPANRVELIQKRLDHEEQLNNVSDSPDPEELEKGFIEAAKDYSERKGISYPAWREVGVPAATLKAAGIPQRRRPTK